MGIAETRTCLLIMGWEPILYGWPDTVESKNWNCPLAGMNLSYGNTIVAAKFQGEIILIMISMSPMPILSNPAFLSKLLLYCQEILFREEDLGEKKNAKLFLPFFAFILRRICHLIYLL
ncbi:MAG: hypothetical protein V4714_02835 [Bacteroidota bacterium]